MSESSLLDTLLDQQAQCGCGWKGPRRFLYMLARDDMIEHALKEHGLGIRVVRLVAGADQHE